MGEVFEEYTFEGEDPSVHFDGAVIRVWRGDPGWLDIHAELLALHVDKASSYGTSEDKLANYVATSGAVGEPDEFTCWVRMLEKCQRALNLIRAGRADECEEGADVAALAVAAEALRRRRLL